MCKRGSQVLSRTLARCNVSTFKYNFFSLAESQEGVEEATGAEGVQKRTSVDELCDLPGEGS